MSRKAAILEELGERELLLPLQIERALAANERAKFFFALLQAAAQRARSGETSAAMGRERLAAGLDEPFWDRLAREARLDERDRLVLPRAGEIHREITRALGEMLAPLASRGEDGPFAERLAALGAAGEPPDGDAFAPDYVARVTSGRRGERDSPHLLVMDLHRELNRLQGELASTRVAGASAYGLESEDVPRVEAFMRGVARTSHLKFDHPGLATTASRVGPRLVLQNDLGTTDAHVLVVKVEGLDVTVTYSDVHAERARFFVSLFDGRGFDWSGLEAREALRLGESDGYLLVVGSHRASGEEELLGLLELLGSRLVFLIDWNRARKRLRPLVGKRHAVELLRWAADHELGHRAFLELGGERLVYEAVEYAAKAPLRYGQPLTEVLSREDLGEFLRFVLRTASEGLRAGRSPRLLRDEIKAELGEYLETSEERLLALGGRHAAAIFDLAIGVVEVLGTLPDAGRAEAIARRAKRHETHADELVQEVRVLVERSAGTEAYLAIISAADDAADAIEEATFLLSVLLTREGEPDLRPPLAELAGFAHDGACELVRAFETARHVRRGGVRQDVQDFLTAVDELVALEHRADEGHRLATVALLRDAAGFQQLYLATQVAGVLESSTDHLARCGLYLRDHVLKRVTAQ